MFADCMAKDFTKDLQRLLSFAREEAARLGNRQIGPDHIFLALLRDGNNEAVKILNSFSVSPDIIKAEMESVLREADAVPFEEAGNLAFSSDIDEFYRNVSAEISAGGMASPNMKHVLLAVLRDSGTTVAPILRRYGITYASVKDIEADLTADADAPQAGPVQAEPAGQAGDTHSETASQSGQPAKAQPAAAEGRLSQKSASAGQAVEQPEMPQGDVAGKRQPKAGPAPQPQSSKKKNTPTIDKFGTDLTAQAAAGRLDPVVGREKEVERLLQVLSRRKKNNPVLVGEPGVGKSAIVELLAQKIVAADIPPMLRGKRIVTLDMGAIVAGTKYRGQFEERMRGIVEELKEDKDTIIFLDELHTIVGAGAQAGALDAANLLKPALARGEIQCIGATTLDEYRQVIEKDGALERRFQKIIVEPTDYEQTLAVLQNIKPWYEKHHNVTYTDEAIKACVSLSTRYITDRVQPDKAVDVLDEAGARASAVVAKASAGDAGTDTLKQLDEVREQKRLAAESGDFKLASELKQQEQQLMEQHQAEYEQRLAANRSVIDEEAVAEVVSMMTNIPVHRVSESEGSKLLHMADKLKESIVGQDDAIDKVVRAIERNRAGLRDPNKPIGTFIFLGKTGVGKTQLAKKLAECMFDSADNIIRVDMSEYMEKYSVSSLIGAPPGYVGYDEGGQLSEKVRRKPYSVVLFDEIEKAHPDIFNILLQVLDEGRLTDAAGRHVDFRNTILIMTSNIGSKEVSELGGGVGFKTAGDDPSKRQRAIIDKALARKFSPEFLNRIDDRVLFNSLTREDISKILDIELSALHKRLNQIGYNITVTEATRNNILDEGYDPEFGARPLKRAIQKWVEDPVAEKIISGVSPADLTEI